MPEQLSFINTIPPAALPSRFAELTQPPATLPHQLLRQQTASQMQCKNCGRDLWITPSGFLVCSDIQKSCSRLMPMRRLKEMRLAWPERVIDKK